MKDVVVSGIRPTGKLHLGNYFGAFKNFLRLQEQFDSYFFIADYHSLTTHPTPGDLSASVKRVLAEYIALGLDPEKCTIYFQSDLPETAELYLFLNMNAYLGELERVTSFKEKARTQPNNINAGLLTYPVLMAADILLHRGVKVPVGKDQEQHLEMARTFANRFNRLYQNEYFPEPQAFSFEQNLVKVPGLTGTGKMSKSAGEADTIYLDEEASVLNKKIMRAVSDSGPSEPGAPKSVPVQNLFDLMGLVCTPETIQFFDDAHKIKRSRQRTVASLFAEDQFDKQHFLDRREEVEADEVLRPGRGFGETGDRQGRGVGILLVQLPALQCFRACVERLEQKAAQRCRTQARAGSFP